MLLMVNPLMVICQELAWQLQSVAASTVLIRPKLKELLEGPVLKNLKGDDKIDLTSLTKIALQNTARPMMDATSWKKKANTLHHLDNREQG